MKKRVMILTALLTALLLFAGCSAGEASKTGITFRNNTGTTLDNLYLTSVNSDVWGDPLTSSRLKDGGTAHISFSKIGGASGELFDFGAINSDGRCFDVYDLELRDGDTLELGPETTIDGLASTTMIVTHADGTMDTYFGYCYYESDLEETEIA